MLGKIIHDLPAVKWNTQVYKIFATFRWSN